jgi:hypothetical protein
MNKIPFEYYSCLWYFELSKNMLARVPQLNSLLIAVNDFKINDLWNYGLIDEPSYWSSGLTEKGRAAKMKYDLLK